MIVAPETPDGFAAIVPEGILATVSLGLCNQQLAISEWQDDARVVRRECRHFV